MKTAPNPALRGATSHPAWARLVHLEWIAERSSCYHQGGERHAHDALIQVLYPVRGVGETFIDNRLWALHTPCLIIAPARSVHSFQFSPDLDGPVITAAQRPLESLAAAAAPGLLQTLRRPAVIEVDPASRHAVELMPLFQAIGREAATQSPGQVGAGMALLLALFVQIARIGQVAGSSDAMSRARKSSQIERFRALLDEHCRDRMPVAAYAREMGVTPGQLTRMCHEALGMSALDAINSRVVHEAQRELVYSTLAIKQVAAVLGFDDEAYFGRYFKKQTGLRPTQFRDMARHKLAGT